MMIREWEKFVTKLQHTLLTRAHVPATSLYLMTGKPSPGRREHSPIFQPTSWIWQSLFPVKPSSKSSRSERQNIGRGQHASSHEDYRGSHHPCLNARSNFYTLAQDPRYLESVSKMKIRPICLIPKTLLRISSLYRSQTFTDISISSSIVLAHILS